MEYYSGLDVSLKDTFVTIIDKNGDLVKEQIVPTNVESIWECLQ